MLTHSRMTVAMGVLAVGLVACGDDGPQRADPPVTTGVAPSKSSASTIAAPASAPPCDVGELQFSAGDAVVLIRNNGSIECEVDVSQSPNRDPLMEPSIWLDRGGEGEIAVEVTDQGCARPRTVDSVDLVVNGELTTAPVSLPPVCDVTLTAIYTD